MGIQFLSAGASLGEKVLFIALGEKEENIRGNAKTFGYDLNGVTFLDLSPTADFFVRVETYDLFSAAEVEREPVTQNIVKAIEELRPKRVFIDSLTQFRYLAPDNFQFRKEVLSFLHFLSEKDATVLFSSEATESLPDDDLQFMADGIIHFGGNSARRTITVSKYRGSDYLPGSHSMKISSKGIEMFPFIIPEPKEKVFVPKELPFGIEEFDQLLHGGLTRGTITIISGPSGAGKTSLGLTFISEAAKRGERSKAYLFEEELEILLSRCDGINIPVRTMLKDGNLSIVRLEPLIYSSDEFINMIRKDVEENNTSVVMIDSISGYILSLQGDNLPVRLHSMCKYLQNLGVTVLIINEMETITGDFRATEAGISYLGDNLIFLRYLEMYGEMRKAIGVLKKRCSDFEKTLREIEITDKGIKVGKPLTGLRGILNGTPTWITPPPERII
jgi:circadian clock protein KaiC